MLFALGGCSCDGPASGTGAGWHRPRAPRLDVADAAVVDELAAVVEPAPDAAGSAPRPVLIAPPGSLDAFFASLQAAEQRAPGGRVLISIFGDSHTAGDALTGRLRAKLQARFGDAGRGLVAAGRPPYRHYYQHDLAYGSTGTWRALVGGRKADAEPFGLMGFRVEASRSAEAWVETCASCPTGRAVSRFEVLYWQQPGGGDLEYRVDAERWQRISTSVANGARGRAEVLAVPVADGDHKLTVRRGRRGVVALFGIALERDQPGVVIDGLGIVGRRVSHLHGWDWGVIGAQLARRDPRLVVIQYGTNEADDPDLDLTRLARQYDEVVRRTRAATPRASILLLGPPDMGVRAAGKACDQLPPPPTPLAGTVQPDAWLPPECAWRTPATLAGVVDVQREVAARHGVAFFDSFAAMGGADRMAAFVASDPRMAYRDRVHFTDAGYRVWADALLGELVPAYERWGQPPPPPPPPSDEVEGTGD